MNAWVIIVLIMTASGPREVRFDAPSARECHQAAITLNQVPPQVRDGIFISARCVHEFET